MALIEARIGHFESSQAWMDKAVEQRAREANEKVSPKRLEEDIQREIRELRARKASSPDP